MFFQLVDIRRDCPIVYANGEFVNQLQSDFDKTWSYSSFLKDKKNIQFAKLYCGGKTLEEICPRELKLKWAKVSKRMSAFHTSLRESKVNYGEVCLVDIIPESILKDFCEVKNQICEYVFKTFAKPLNYDFLLDIEKMILGIEKRSLNTLEGYSKHILYNQFGSKNGRLTTKPRSFPILVLNKKDRHIFKPQNDFFLSLDYSCMEVRALNFLLEKETPHDVDSHEWNAKNIFKKGTPREQAKKEIFAWLYNYNYKNEVFEKHYNREYLLEKYFKNGEIVNPYGRKLFCDRFHAINYLVSSFATDIFLRQCLKVNQFLNEQKAQSYITALIHDCILVDVCGEEKEIIKKCIDIFRKDCYNHKDMMVKVEMGKNFGEMKEIARVS